MARPFGIHTISDIYQPNVLSQVAHKSWAKAVATPYQGRRLRAAWWVLTGRAEAVVWPQPGDLERALGQFPHPLNRSIGR